MVYCLKLVLLIVKLMQDSFMHKASRLIEEPVGGGGHGKMVKDPGDHEASTVGCALQLL